MRRLVGAAVVQRDLDVVGGFDDVVVGQDVAVGADDDAGAEAGVGAAAAFRALAEEVAEDRVVEQRVALRLHLLRGVDVHHGGQGRTGRIAIRTGGAPAGLRRRSRPAAGPAPARR
jgi:hypothetical protein